MVRLESHGGKDILVFTPRSRFDALIKANDRPGIKPEGELSPTRGLQGAMPYYHDILADMVKALPPQSFLRLGHRTDPDSRDPASHIAWQPRQSGPGRRPLRSEGTVASNEESVDRAVGIAADLGLEVASHRGTRNHRFADAGA